MLALAHRIASYVGEERAARRQPIFNLTLPNMAPPERDASQVRALSSFVFAENTRLPEIYGTELLPPTISHEHHEIC